MKSLFRISGFIPYIFIILLNAMTDLGHKIVLQNTVFKAYDSSELIMLTAVINSLILLPFIFLFYPAGVLSDKYPKTKIIEYASAFAILITSLILVSYYMGWFWVAFGLTFVLAGQSAIYSPAKYGLIKEMAGKEHLVSANALVQSVTIVSILVGGVVYSIFFEYLLRDRSIEPSQILEYIAPIGYLLIASSVVEYLLARRLVQKFKRVNNPNSVKEKVSIKIITQNRAVWLSIIGLSIFWGVSQVVVAIFGDFLKSNLGITDTIVVQGLIAISGIGIIIGSLFAGRVSKNHIETGIIPLGALGVSLSLYMLPSLQSVWSLGIVLIIYGFFAGLFVVPLNSLIQFATPTDRLGKVLAGNNLMQNISMFGFLVMTALFGYFELSSIWLFYIVAFIAFLGMGYTLWQLPQSLVRYLVRLIVGFRYRLDVDGLENIKGGKGILLLGNHISFLDWAILQMAYPEQIRFVMERHYYDKWYLRGILDFFEVIPISSRGSKGALAKVTKALNDGQTVALYPEGHISRNGHLGEFQRGFEIALRGVENTIIIPFYIRGLWEDDFSYASKKMKNKKTKDISVSFGKPISSDSDTQIVKKAVIDLSIEGWKNYANRLPCVPKAWIYSAKEVGNGLCMADSTGVEVSGDRFITGVVMMASSLSPIVKKSQNLGVLLPTSVGGSMGNMALLSLGKTIVNLNYSSGEDSLLYSLDIADITQIVTSKKFITKLKAKGFDLSKVLDNVEVIYLEDIKHSMSKTKAILTLGLVKIAPAWLLSLCFVKSSDTDDTVAILFSSGSEGRPKGIALTHKNIMGNIKQTVTVLNPKEDDIMLGTLPIFHSFGLTVTTLLPLIEGIPVVCHTDPTDGLGIGKITAKYKATILLGTATFFRLYTRNRRLHPLMFDSLRLVIAGAEKLSIEIREAFKDKFGHNIYEGYGATETTPVASVNIPNVLMQESWRVQVGNKIGTVGLPVPGSSFKIVNPDTYQELPIEDEGMVLIGGTQIMKGYIKDHQKTLDAIIEIDGIRWYITGDKGRVDSDGFLTIVDRYSRFAKIAGEMISLGLVETKINKILDEENQVAITAIPDSKKGERLVLLLEGTLDIKELKDKIKTIDLNPLYIPTTYHKVESLPRLGTGKADLKGLKVLALELG